LEVRDWHSEFNAIVIDFLIESHTLILQLHLCQIEKFELMLEADSTAQILAKHLEFKAFIELLPLLL
jgi:hypothetical protein